MKILKKLIAILAVTALAAGCLCGCAAGGGDTSADVTSDKSSESVDGVESSESAENSESGSEVGNIEIENMPIISGGKYNDSYSTGVPFVTCVYIPYETGKVYYAEVRSPSPTDIDLYFPRDDALHAVYINCCYSTKNVYDTQEYKDGKAQIEEEYLQNKIALAEKLFDSILNEYGDEGIDAIISDLNSYEEFWSITPASRYITSATKYYKDNQYNCQQYKFSYFAKDLDDYRKCGKSAFTVDDYTVFCMGLIDYCLGSDGTYDSGSDVRSCLANRVYRTLSEAKGKDYLKWKDPLNDELVALYQEKTDKQQVLWRSLYNSAAGLDRWYESLENSGAKIYEKTVYYVYNGCDGLDNSVDHYLSGPKVYKIAFLTKEQIKSIQLNGDESYALRIVLACDELATMENNTVYIEKELKFEACAS